MNAFFKWFFFLSSMRTVIRSEACALALDGGMKSKVRAVDGDHSVALGCVSEDEHRDVWEI